MESRLNRWLRVVRERFDTRSAMVIVSASGALPLLAIALASPTFLKPDALPWLAVIVLFTAVTVLITVKVGKLSDGQFAVLGAGGMVGVALSAFLIADPSGTRAVTSMLAVVPAIAASGSPKPITVALTTASMIFATILSITTLSAAGIAVTAIAVGAALTTVLVPVILISTVTGSLRTANERLEILASTDPLTGLLNRRGMLPRVHGLVAGASAADQAVTAMVIDIDRFKKVNDEYGHATGDAVLVTVAETLAGAVIDGGPPDSILARLGGEEFLVVARHDGTDRLETTILDAVRAQCPVTVSIGILHTRISERTLSELDVETIIDNLARETDKALYIAKDQGRDRRVYAAAGPLFTDAAPQAGASGRDGREGRSRR